MLFDLWRYFERSPGPFINLSDASPEKAHAVLTEIKA